MNPPDSPGLVIQVNRVGEWEVPVPILERAVLAVCREEGVTEGELSLTFLDDDGIRSLNREYLGRDRPTDVIAFPLHDPGQALVGDIYVGYEQAVRQAESEAVEIQEELVRLAIHGTLHVLGHDHPLGEERWSSPMYTLQEEILRRILAG